MSKDAAQQRLQERASYFMELLTLMFIYLKLTGQITWPWVWVLSPIWITIGVGLAIAALFIWVIKR
jgi:hypothetical protein